MRYLTVGDVIRLHQLHLGISEPVVDFGLLESAVLRPQQSVAGQDAYPDIHTKAAAFFHSLVCNHCFPLHGNKRTAVVALVLFYELNAWELDMEQGEMVELALSVALHQVETDELAKLLSDKARKRQFEDDDEEEGPAGE